MATNQNEFLSKLSKKLGRECPESVKKPNWSVSPQWSVFEGLTQDELVEKLEEQCENIHTEIKHTITANLTKAMQSILNDWNANSIIFSNDDRFEQYGLTSFFTNENYNSRKWDMDHKDEYIEFAKKAHVGITFSDITLAESGTVVLYNDGKKGRPVSLLPESYIAIVPKSTIVPRLTQAVKAIHEQNENGEKLAPCFNFISGPSNSADIEMNLVVGVHGPVRTTYIIVDDQ